MERVAITANLSVLCVLMLLKRGVIAVQLKVTSIVIRTLTGLRTRYANAQLVLPIRELSFGSYKLLLTNLNALNCSHWCLIFSLRMQY